MQQQFFYSTAEPINRTTFIWRRAAKVPREKLSDIHSNKHRHSTATSKKRPRPASCRPKGDYVVFYTSFEEGRFQLDESKGMTI